MLLNILALVLLISLTIISYILVKKGFAENTKFLKSVAVFLFTYKTIEIVFGIILGDLTKYPIEYSTIFYFFFSLVIISKNKKLLGAATTGAFISGTGYLVFLVFNINNMVESHRSIGHLPGFMIGMLSHSILYVLSIMYMTTNEFNYKKEIVRINLIAILIGIHAGIMNQFIDYDSLTVFINVLIYGDALPFFKKNLFLKILYFPFILLLYNLAIFGFYKLNALFVKRYEEQEIQTAAT
ncbi:MAG: hypothetical protein RBQ97_11080 [Acholeplasma sp.]|nr:hypothetical protein [Acholeplasma sp.]